MTGSAQRWHRSTSAVRMPRTQPRAIVGDSVNESITPHLTFRVNGHVFPYQRFSRYCHPGSQAEGTHIRCTQVGVRYKTLKILLDMFG